MGARDSPERPGLIPSGQTGILTGVAIELERRVAAIEERNRRVEGDKAWERSVARRLVIAVITYLIVLSYGCTMGADRPFLTAVVPTVGFLLSTITVPVIKRYWVQRHNRRHSSARP